MDLRLQSASIGGFAISGGGNGVTVKSFSWKKAPRTERYARPRSHGSIDKTRYYDGRLYTLTGYLYGATEAGAQTLLDSFEQAVALGNDAVAFTFQLAGRTEAETADVRVDGDLEYAFDAVERGLVRWALTLFAEDPRRYSITERTGEYAPVTVGVVNLPLVNGGNYPTPPTWRIYGPIDMGVAGAATLVNDTTGETIALTGLGTLEALAFGSMITIDVAARDVLKSLSDNLVTNPGFEVDTTGWAAANGSAISRTTVQFKYGAASCQIITGASAARFLLLSTASCPAAAVGNTFETSCYVKGTAGKPVRLMLLELDAANATLSTSTGPTVTADGTWQLLTLEHVVAQATAAKLQFSLEKPGDATIQTYYADAITMKNLNAPPAQTSRRDLVGAAATVWGDLAAGTNVVRLTGTGTSSRTFLTCTYHDARI